MRTKVLLCLAVVCLWCASTAAQDAKMQPLTFWYEYSINPGKEAQFLELVKTVGAPVRDKLMAEGVVLAWGVQTPLLRIPGAATHQIWYTVADWSGVEKVDAALRAQIARLDEEAMKAGATKKGAAPAAGVTAKMMEIADIGRTHDYVTRDLVFVSGNGELPADTLPWARYTFVKAKPGKGPELRRLWEKYNKPVMDKLVADGVILAYGFAIEDVRTDGDFTHYVWYATKDLGAMEKVRNAFTEDRDKRSQEEQDAITQSFAGALDPDATRGEIDHAVIFKLRGMK
ncbi:MAG TPA: hypothetical protein VL128_17405 [Candidatus Eisenbacteria bacterium]|nr:hypothetical protein [Candidatus Eisenbacteria bacterium]